jgi:hypothetical protein
MQSLATSFAVLCFMAITCRGLKDTGHRTVLLTPYHDAYALDTSQAGLALVSVPVFCGRLVERIVATIALDEWDTDLINTAYPQ